MSTPWLLVAIVVLILLVALGLIMALLLRVRALGGKVGAFECALRTPTAPRWVSGIACFTDDSVQWYRLVSLSTRPRHRFRREEIVLGAAQRRGAAGDVVEVRAHIGKAIYDFGMHEDSHSALIVWLESATPKLPTLL